MMKRQSAAPATTITVRVPSKATTFTVGVLPGTSDAALRTALAARVRLPPTYLDGSDSFFLTLGESHDAMVVPVCVNAIPQGVLTMHIHDAPDASTQSQASRSSDAQVLERLASEAAAASASAAAALEAVLDRLRIQDQTAPAEALASPALDNKGEDRSKSISPVQILSPPTLGGTTSNSLAQRLADPQLRAATTVQAHFRGRLSRTKAQAHKLAKQRSYWGHCVWLHDTLQEILHKLKLEHFAARFMPGYVSKYELVKEASDPDELYGMAKMSRLGTDLANERTLLAWVRTILAIMRTAFAMLALQGVNATWEVVRYVATALMLVLMLGSAVTGIYRFYRIDRIVSLKEIPSSFGKNRIPLWPVNAVLVGSLVTVTLAMLFEGYEKQ